MDNHEFHGIFYYLDKQYSVRNIVKRSPTGMITSRVEVHVGVGLPLHIMDNVVKFPDPPPSDTVTSEDEDQEYVEYDTGEFDPI